MKKPAAMPMRRYALLLLGLVFAVSICDAVPASAGGNLPYCMSRVAGRIGMVEECDYMSMEQCWASSAGVNGSCAPNWRLQYYRQQHEADEPVVRRRHKRQH